MKVLKYAVNKEPELINIENGLEAMQSEVDGYIETVTFPSVNAVLVCNEEGNVKNYHKRVHNPPHNSRRFLYMFVRRRCIFRRYCRSCAVGDKTH